MFRLSSEWEKSTESQLLQIKIIMPWFFSSSFIPYFHSIFPQRWISKEPAPVTNTTAGLCDKYSIFYWPVLFSTGISSFLLPQILSRRNKLVIGNCLSNICPFSIFFFLSQQITKFVYCFQFHSQHPRMLNNGRVHKFSFDFTRMGLKECPWHKHLTWSCALRAQVVSRCTLLVPLCATISQTK